MPRPILTNEKIHPAIQKIVADNQANIIAEVQHAMSNNKVLVVGMGHNPETKKARKKLQELGIEHVYLEYGNYFNNWYRRNGLKMWTGWPSFPMIFIKGVLIGGYKDLTALIETDKLNDLVK